MRLTMRIGQLVSVVYIAYAIYIVHTPHIMHWTRMVRNKKNSYDTHATKVSLKFVCEAKQNNCYSVIFGSSNMSLFCLYVIYIPFIRVCVCVLVWYGWMKISKIWHILSNYCVLLIDGGMNSSIQTEPYNLQYQLFHSYKKRQKKTKTENSYNYTLVVFRMYSSHITHILFNWDVCAVAMCVMR